jgi:AraC-like DNA-binding protein
MNHQYLIRSGALAGYEQLINFLGGDPEKLISACNLTKLELKSQDKLIPFSSMIELLELTARELKTPNFALQLGQNQNIEALGSLGLLIGNCNTVREALITTQRYMAVHSQAEYWRFKELGRFACIDRSSVMPSPSHARQIKELSFAVGFKLLKTFLNGKVRLERVEFAHAPISDLAVYKKYFGCEVLFNQEHDRILLPLHYLDCKMSKITLQDSVQLESILGRQLAENHHDIERQVSTVISQLIGSQSVSIDVVANILNIHKRTLQRQLKASGLNFNTTLREIRISTACWHLEASTIDITLLAEILGYSDISAFSRGFKSHKGCSPLQWRKQQSTGLN